MEIYIIFYDNIYSLIYVNAYSNKEFAEKEALRLQNETGFQHIVSTKELL